MPLVKRRTPARSDAAASMLDAPDSASRRAAALALAGDAAGAAALLGALAVEPVREVRVAMITALMTTRTEEVAAGLAGLLASDDVALRNDAIEALRQMGDVAQTPLRAVLRDSDTDQRICAVNALDQVCAPWARDCLRRVLAADPEVNVGLAAVDALSATGTPDDAPALTAFAARFPQEPMVDFAVRRALGRLGAARV